jgi:homoserine dehydrogenase
VLRKGITVVKFGSSVLREETDSPVVVEEIARWVGSEQNVLAVVSAFGNTTDDLFRKANSFGELTNQEAVARLVATGEETSAALLALALGGEGIRSKVLGPDQMGLIAKGEPLDARLVAVSAEQIWFAFTESDVVVVPGFIARTAHGSVVLLGRGGSDLTAVFLAHELRASRCGLIKDAEGLYTSDPNSDDGIRPERYERLDWEKALGLRGGVVQVKALEFARVNRLKFEVAAVGSSEGTVVGDEA